MGFESRYNKYKKELEQLYSQLYGNLSGFEAFKNLLDHRFEDRSSELKVLDGKRRINSSWYLSKNMLGVTMYTELFAGSLKGLERKLDYLESLGVSYLHLMPLLKMPHPQNDGGYAVDSFTEIDPKFGTNLDLSNLTKAMRKRGISLCMDFVMNHTADSHPWALAAIKGDEEAQKRFFFYDDLTIPNYYDSIVPQVFPSTAPGNFTFNKETGKWVLTSFYPFQWDLNYSNPVVLCDIVDSMLSLANLGVEVFRLDAVPYIWKRLGTNCRNLQEVHTIVRIIRISMELVCPSVILKGEVVMAPQELAAYFGTVEQPECHLLYNAATMANFWDSLASQDTRLLTKQVNSILSLPSHCHFVNYLRCHDDLGWAMDDGEERALGIDPLEHKKFVYHFFEGSFPGSYSRGELYNYDSLSQDARSCGTLASFCGLEEAIKERDDFKIEKAIERILLLNATMFSVEGFPLLSSGDEIAQLNDYSYHLDKDRSDDSRNLHRSKFDWQKAKQIKVENSYQKRVFDGLQKLLSKRKSHCCFSSDAMVTTWNPNNDKTFLIRRTIEDKELLCFASFSDEEETVRTDCIMGTFKDLFSDRRVVPGWSFVLKPHEFLWCEKEKD